MQKKAKQQVDEPTKDEAEAAAEQPASPSGKGRSDAGRPAEDGAAVAEEGAEAAEGRADVSGEAAEAGAEEARASDDAEPVAGAAQAQGAAEPPEGADDGGGDATAAEDQEDQTEQEHDDEEAAAEPADAEEEDVPVTAQVSVEAHGREEAAAGGSGRPPRDAAYAEALVADLASVRSEAASYLDDLRRLQADFDNYRKRMLREQTVRVAAASQALVTRLLPVLDNFELAISHAEQSRDFDRMLKGVEMVFGELREVLRNEGLSDIEAEGKPFDPSCHEAVVAVEEEGSEPGTVVDVVRAGYEFQGKVLRPAMVKVAK
ncbi:MAG TPA: nucleotide exchange factor GrpE [Actinomycetota bacterium]